VVVVVQGINLQLLRYLADPAVAARMLILAGLVEQ
jgi:hypothetical protein